MLSAVSTTHREHRSLIILTAASWLRCHCERRSFSCGCLCRGCCDRGLFRHDRWYNDREKVLSRDHHRLGLRCTTSSMSGRFSGRRAEILYTDVSLGELVCALFYHLFGHVRSSYEEAHAGPFAIKLDNPRLKETLRQGIMSGMSSTRELNIIIPSVRG